MKKINILGLGTIALTALPIIAISSCSTAPPQKESILEKEIAKFEQQFIVKNEVKEMSIKDAVLAINTATNEEKMKMLEGFVDLPPKSELFNYEVKEAAPDSKALKVSLTITEVANPENTKTIELVVGGFKTELNDLEKSLELLVNKPTLFPQNKKVTVLEAQHKITSKQIFDTYYEPIEMPAGITYDFVSSKPHPLNGTILEVTLKVSDASTSVEHNIQLTNFTKPQDKLEEQAKLLVSQASLRTDLTAGEAKEAIQNTSQLNSFYKPITMSYGIEYVFASSKVNEQNNTTLDVTLRVIGEAETIPQQVIVQITGFQQPSILQEEANKYAIALSAINKAEKTNEVINKINGATDKLTTLKGLVKGFPEPKEGYTVAVGTASQNETSRTSVNVAIIVTETRNSQTANVTFTITDLAKEVVINELTKEAEKFNVSLPALNATTRITTLMRNINEANIEELKLAYVKEIINLPTLSRGFTIKANSATFESSAPRSLKVSLTITWIWNNEKENVVLTITNLVAETFQEEMVRLANAALVDKKVLVGKRTESAEEAVAKMNNENLRAYYKHIELAKGISYSFKGAVVQADNVVVTVTVKGGEGTTPIDRSFKILDFMTPLKREADKFTNLIYVDWEVYNETENQFKREVNQAATQNEKKVIIKKYLPTFIDSLAQGFTFEIGTAIRGEYPGRVIIPITVIQASDNTKQVVNFQSSGWYAESEEEELERLARTLLIDKPVVDQHKNVTSAAALKLLNNETLDNYYSRVILEKNVTYKFKSAVAKGRKITVTVVITNSNPEYSSGKPISIETTFVIYDFDSTNLSLVESEKFDITMIALDNTLAATVAARNINEAENNEAKIAAINKLVKDFPTVTNGFAINIDNAKVRIDEFSIEIEDFSVLDISITISKPGDSNIKPTTIIFSIIGFNGIESIQKELDRIAKTKLIAKTVLAGKQTETASIASGKITNENLKDYYTPINLGYGITYTFAAARVSGTTLTVVFKVTGIEGTTPIYVSIPIAGFKAPGSALENELAKFGNSININSGGLVLPSEIVRRINEAPTQERKIREIRNFVTNFPDVTNGFTLVIGNATVDPKDSTWINVELTISENGASSSTKVIFTMKGKEPETPQQELERLVRDNFDNKITFIDFGKKLAIEVVEELKKGRLNEYYRRPQNLPTEISYEYQTSWTNGGKNVYVMIKAWGIVGAEPIYHTFYIRGFKEAYQETDIQATKFSVSLPITNTVMLATNAVTDINQSEDKLAWLRDNIKNFPTASNDVLVEVGEASVDPKIPSLVNVPISFKIRPGYGGYYPGSPVTVNFVISDLMVQKAGQ